MQGLIICDIGDYHIIYALEPSTFIHHCLPLLVFTKVGILHSVATTVMKLLSAVNLLAIAITVAAQNTVHVEVDHTVFVQRTIYFKANPSTTVAVSTTTRSWSEENTNVYTEYGNGVSASGAPDASTSVEESAGSSSYTTASPDTPSVASSDVMPSLNVIRDISLAPLSLSSPSSSATEESTLHDGHEIATSESVVLGSASMTGYVSFGSNGVEGPSASCSYTTTTIVVTPTITVTVMPSSLSTFSSSSLAGTTSSEFSSPSSSAESSTSTDLTATSSYLLESIISEPSGSVESLSEPAPSPLTLKGFEYGAPNNVYDPNDAIFYLQTRNESSLPDPELESGWYTDASKWLTSAKNLDMEKTWSWGPGTSTTSLYMRLDDLSVWKYQYKWENPWQETKRLTQTQLKKSPFWQIEPKDVLLDSANKYGNKIVQFALDNFGKTVGGGECWDLTRAILLKEQLVSWNYVHGYPILEAAVDSEGKQHFNLNRDEIRPGDIIQYRLTKLNIDGAIWQYGTPDHTAIVELVEGKRLNLLLQNISPCRCVQRTHHDIDAIVGGHYVVYRPMSLDWQGRSLRNMESQ